MESYLVRKEQCPECAKQGKDNSHDNLAVYSDGHSHCFSCGFTISNGVISRFRQRISSTRELDKQKSGLYLPEDCDTVYPSVALDWIEQYELTKTDLLNNNALWSESSQRLIFPVYGDSGLLAYQGRYFGPPSSGKPYPKWYGKGDLGSTFNILGRSSSSKLVLTEDIISAIKCSKFCLAMPLYGSHVGVVRFKRLYSLYGKTLTVSVYLDPDKRKEAVLEARRGTLVGLNTETIFSDKDPKEHTYEELKEILE